MSVEQVTDMSAFEDALEEPPLKLHWYSRDPRYRLSGMLRPQPGDIAECGHVCSVAMSELQALQLPPCERCERLKAIRS